MTKEEAIVHIKDVICENNTIKPKIAVFEQEKEALYRAIKALEQEPCEDCISRVEAIKALEYNLSIEVNGGLDKHRTITLLNAICNAQKKAIEDLPSVTPQPKTECSCNQIKWERDTAIAQLKELGYGLGEKPKPDFEHKAEIVISQLRADRDRLQDAIKKIRAEIVETAQCTMNDNRASGMWTCRDIIDKYTAESEE